MLGNLPILLKDNLFWILFSNKADLFMWKKKGMRKMCVLGYRCCFIMCTFLIISLCIIYFVLQLSKVSQSVCPLFWILLCLLNINTSKIEKVSLKNLRITYLDERTLYPTKDWNLKMCLSCFGKEDIKCKLIRT